MNATVNDLNSGVLDAMRKLADLWRLDDRQAAALLGMDEADWAAIRTGEQDRLLGQDSLFRAGVLIGISKALHELFSDPLANQWVRLPNSDPLFSGLSPRAYMVRGGLAAMRATRRHVDALQQGLRDMGKLKAADLPATGWQRIDVAALWPGTLLPLLESSPDLQRSLEAAMADWIESLHDSERPPAPWRWAEANDLPPFLVARGERGRSHISDRIHAAAEAYNSRAIAYDALSIVLYDVDLGLPAKMKRLLETKHAELWTNSCHDATRFFGCARIPVAIGSRRSSSLWPRPGGLRSCGRSLPHGCIQRWSRSRSG